MQKQYERSVREFCLFFFGGGWFAAFAAPAVLQGKDATAALAGKAGPLLLQKGRRPLFAYPPAVLDHTGLITKPVAFVQISNGFTGEVAAFQAERMPLDGQALPNRAIAAVRGPFPIVRAAARAGGTALQMPVAHHAIHSAGRKQERGKLIWRFHPAPPIRRPAGMPGRNRYCRPKTPGGAAAPRRRGMDKPAYFGIERSDSRPHSRRDPFPCLSRRRRALP